MIFVVDDDAMMAECVVRACKEARGKTPNNGGGVRRFTNAIEAIQAMDGDEVPKLIFLDILLDGPDGFALLAEMMSYEDTAKVPVVIVTSLDMSRYNLSAYGVVGVLEKEKMKPEDVRRYVEQYAN